MIDLLLLAMQETGLLLSDHEIDTGSEEQSFLQDEDIADALWLAAKIGGAYETVKPDESTTTNAEDSTIVIDDASSRLIAPPPTVSAYMPATGDDLNGQNSKTPDQGLPIQVQSAPALPDTLAIARSLRPLMRKVPSAKRFELDVMATVNRIAERDIWVPILQRSPERWFDLEIVIEAAEFSFIWQDTIDEFQRLLEKQGAFRNVRTWYVRESATGNPQLLVKKQQNEKVASGSSSRSPKELLDAAGRCVVLYISDCRSPIWQQGKIHDWLGNISITAGRDGGLPKDEKSGLKRK
jgi:hypothetical protein